MRNFLKAAFAAGIFTTFCATCGAMPMTITAGLFTFSNITCTNVQDAAGDCANSTLTGAGYPGLLFGSAFTYLTLTDDSVTPGTYQNNPDIFYLTYDVTYTGPYLNADLPLSVAERVTGTCGFFSTCLTFLSQLQVDSTSFQSGAYFSLYTANEPDPQIETVEYVVADPTLTPEPSTLSYTSLFAVVGLLVAVQHVRRSSRVQRDGC